MDEIKIETTRQSDFGNLDSKTYKIPMTLRVIVNNICVLEWRSQPEAPK